MKRDNSYNWHDEILEQSHERLLDCLGAEGARVFSIERTENGFLITEQCDGYYGTTLSHSQLEMLINELKELARSE